MLFFFCDIWQNHLAQSTLFGIVYNIKNQSVFVFFMPLQTRCETAVMNATTAEFQSLPFQTSVKAALSMLPCFFFLYVNAIMMFALLKKPLLLESSRYILFGHLLMCDSVQLLLTMLLYIFAVMMVRMINYVCVFVSLLAAVTVKMSPLNLAVMSLERYVAVCFPLRHPSFATPRSTGKAIAVMWIVASLDSFIQLFLFVRMEKTIFPMQSFCIRNSVFRLEVYVTLNMAFTILYFVFVSMIIIYTYTAIMITVKSASSRGRHTNKAPKTVLLHLLQLWLYLTSTLFNMINPSMMLKVPPDMAIHAQYVLFVGLIIFPKCLSPLIYGLRDQTLCRVFKNYFTFGFRASVKPSPLSWFQR